MLTILKQIQRLVIVFSLTHFSPHAHLQVGSQRDSLLEHSTGYFWNNWPSEYASRFEKNLSCVVYTFQSCNTRWLTDPLDVFWSLILVTLQTRVPSSWLSWTVPQHSQASLGACKLLRYVAEQLFKTRWREHLRMYLLGPLVTLDTTQLSLQTKTYMERQPVTPKL